MNRRQVVLCGLAGLSLRAAYACGARRRSDRQTAISRQVLEILRNDDLLARIDGIERLRYRHGPETRRAVLGALNHPDTKMRVRASASLGHVGSPAPMSRELIFHMLHNATGRVRLSCAIKLMGVNSEAVRRAYIRALDDRGEKVVQIAALELGERGGPDARAALLGKLGDPSWDIRLAACKALITMRAADGRVVAALEAMKREPAAARYDAFIEESDRMDCEMGFPKQPSWGKMDEIVEEAQRAASPGLR